MGQYTALLEVLDYDTRTERTVDNQAANKQVAAMVPYRCDEVCAELDSQSSGAYSRQQTQQMGQKAFVFCLRSILPS